MLIMDRCFILHITHWLYAYMYSSAAISIDVNERVYGALVQFGCCQHRHK